MTLLLPTLAAAFATFCVWLTVRIVNRREVWAISLAAHIAVGIIVLVFAGGIVCLFVIRWGKHWN